jgi:ABC-2 type transport system ATP-binding protein
MTSGPTWTPPRSTAPAKYAPVVSSAGAFGLDTAAPVVHIDGVTRRFGELVALDRVTFDVHAGEVVALLGHNGAGKTTLLRVINGLLHPDAGTIRTHGLDPRTHGQQVRTNTGVLTEYPALDAFLTARENLALHGAIHDLAPDEVDRRGRELLHELDLEDLADVQTRNLSAGLKQRAALARALLHDPQLLLLDEPTSNLDPIAARTVRNLVMRRARTRGTAVILSTHNLAEAAMVADRVAVIQHGRLLAVGPPSTLGPGRTTGGVSVTVAPDDLATAMDVAAPLADGTTARGDGVTLEALVTPATVPLLVEHLVKAGVAIHAVTPLEPNLEDVYVALHQRTEDA